MVCPHLYHMNLVRVVAVSKQISSNKKKKGDFVSDYDHSVSRSEMMNWIIKGLNAMMNTDEVLYQPQGIRCLLVV